MAHLFKDSVTVALGGPRFSKIVYWLFVPALFWGFLRTVGVPWSDGGAYLGYCLVFILAPGCIVLRLVRSDLESMGDLLGYGAGLGLGLLSLVYCFLLGIGQTDLLFFYPLLPLAIGLANAKRFAPVLRSMQDAQSPAAGLFFLAALFVALTLLLGVSSAFRVPINHHHMFQAMFALALQQPWPPQHLLMADVPISYNWLAHAEMAGAQMVTGIPMQVLAARIEPTTHLAVLVFTLLVFCRRQFHDKGIVAPLAIVQVLWVSGFSALSFGVFIAANPGSISLLISPGFAFILFFILTDFLLAFARRKRFSPTILLCIFFIAFASSGARFPTLPVTLCGLAFVVLARVLTHRQVNLRYLVSLAAVALAFVFSLVYFYGVFSGFPASNTIEVPWTPIHFLTESRSSRHFVVPPLLMDWGLPPAAAALVAFALATVFSAGLLTWGLVYRLRRIVRLSLPDRDLFLVGVFIAGVAAAFMTEAPGASHLSFLGFSQFAIALIGANGLRRLGRDMVLRPRSGWRSLLGVLTVVFLLVRLGELAVVNYQHKWKIPNRLEYPEMWGERWPGLPPSNAIAWLRENAARSPVLIVACAPTQGDMLAFALYAIIKTGGVQVMGLPHLLEYYDPQTGSPLTIGQRLAAFAELETGCGREELLAAPMAVLSGSLAPHRTIYALAPASVVPDQPDRVTEVARDIDFRLYQLQRE